VVTATVPQLGIDDVHRYSLDEYHRLIECGGFDEDLRVELLDGLLVTMSPKSVEHERAIRKLTRWLVAATDGERYEVGVGCPLTLTQRNSEPEPDLFVIEVGTPSPYHPGTAALVVEVSISSLTRDLGIKAPLYAVAGVREYWVLDIEGRRLVVHTDPQADGYAKRREYGANERVTATALALPELDLGELLRAAHG